MTASTATPVRRFCSDKEMPSFSKVLRNAEMFRQQYGDEAAQEYVQHLVDDLKCRFSTKLAQHQAAMEDCLKYFGG